MRTKNTKTIPQLLLLGLCIFTFSIKDSSAQKLDRNYKEAEKYLKVYEYHIVEEEMNEALEKSPNDLLANYYMGIAKLNLPVGDKSDAYVYFKKVYDQNNYFKNINYYMGRVHHLRHEFDDAIRLYKNERDQLPLDKSEEVDKDIDDYEIVITFQEMDRLIHQCEVGKQLVGSPAHNQVLNFDYANTNGPDIAPIITADESTLIFTSHRQEEEDVNLFDPYLNLPYQNVYMMERSEDGGWDEPMGLTEINSEEEHDASIGMSPDGKELYIYKSEGTESANPGSIFVSYLRDGIWTEPVKLEGGMNSNSWDTHTTVSKNSDLMVFTSDRDTDESIGGKDLYIIRKLPDGTWAEPQNAGPKINTPLHEDGPFLATNSNTLYFSSQGQDQNMGGYDIYKAEVNVLTGEISDPVNIGYPLNSAADDIFFSITADESRGYFSSDRPGGHGGNDIYMAQMPNNFGDENIIVLKGKVSDLDSKDPLSALLQVIDLERKEVVGIVNTQPQSGRYSIVLEPNKRYGIQVLKKGYLFKSLNVFMPNQFGYLQITHNFEMQTVGENKVEAMYNISFNNDGTSVLHHSDPELETLKEWAAQNPDYAIEIAVHSQKRDGIDRDIAKAETEAKANGVVALLASGFVPEKPNSGMAPEQLILEAKGYGFEYPLAAYKSTDGEMFNERVEYIVRRKDRQRMVSYDQLKHVPTYSKDEDINCPNCLDLTSEIMPHNVSFNQADFYLTEEGNQNIKNMANTLLACDELTVEVRGHSDGNGTKVFQVALSEKRAQMVAQKLSYYGVASNQVSLKGYGHELWNEDTGNLTSGKVDFKVTSCGQDPLSTNNMYANLSPEALANIEREEEIRLKNEVQRTYIYFGFDSYELDNISKEMLMNIVTYLNNRPEKKIEVYGHTDSKGPMAYNIRLGKKRAKSVADFIIDNNISKKRVTVTTQGEKAPIEDNKTNKGQAQNRRASFIVID